MAEGGIEAAKVAPEAAEKLKQAVQKKYKNPPEKPLIDKASQKIKKTVDQTEPAVKNAVPDTRPMSERPKKEVQKIANTVEEYLDDLLDGRSFRDAGKKGERFLRDNYTQQTPLEKLGNTIGDAVEDTGHAISDFIDDIKDGRTQRKIRQSLEP